jgi:hypothetical protein
MPLYFACVTPQTLLLSCLTHYWVRRVVAGVCHWQNETSDQSRQDSCKKKHLQQSEMSIRVSLAPLNAKRYFWAARVKRMQRTCLTGQFQRRMKDANEADRRWKGKMCRIALRPHPIPPALTLCRLFSHPRPLPKAHPVFL